MKLATTREFRDAVRTHARLHGAVVGDSWTNKGEPNKRTIGFAISNAEPSTINHIVINVEAYLNAHGLTANTRNTNGSVYGHRQYIRGTCAFVK